MSMLRMSIASPTSRATEAASVASRSYLATGIMRRIVQQQPEDADLVDRALRALPAEQRAALLLRDVEGFDYAEIAHITAVEIGTVKSRIHRGRVSVRNALAARGWKGAAG